MKDTVMAIVRTTLFALIFTVVGIALTLTVFRARVANPDAVGSKEHVNYAYGAEDDFDQYTPELRSALLVQKALQKVAKNNMQSVVNISTETVVTVQNPFNDDFYRYFFGEMPKEYQRKQQSLGSGFIIDEEGYLLSNLHVVKDATKIKVTLYGDEEEYDAEIVGIDENTDLALLKIKTDKKRRFPAVRLGDSEKIEMGDFAIAIGNPYGLNNTMTLGIVSAKGRGDVGVNRYQRYIQIDTPINPGNSGGPLFNIFGEVIGVNTMIYSTSGGGNIGIGFAIPINLAKGVIQQLKTTGKVTRGWLGVYPQDIDKSLAQGLGVKPYSGVFVSEVVPNSPASEGGMKDGDIVISVEGKEMKYASDLYRIIASTPVTTKVKVIILRGGKKKTLTITVGERPTEIAQGGSGAESGEWLGMRVAEITDEIRKQYHLSANEEGLIIIGTKEYSPAFDAGLRPGDVIKRIDKRVVSSLEDYKTFVEKEGDESSFIFLIKRGKFVLTVSVEQKKKK